MVGHGITNFLVCRGILGYYSGFMSSLISLLDEHVIQNVDIGGIATQSIDEWVLLIVHFASLSVVLSIKPYSISIGLKFDNNKLMKYEKYYM